MRTKLKPTAILRVAQNFLEHRTQTNREELGLQQSIFLVRTIIWILLGTTATALAWLALAKTDEIVVANGKLEPIGEVKLIQMPVGGVLDKIMVKDGQRVMKGEILLMLDNEVAADSEKSIKDTISSKKQQLKFKEEELKRYLILNANDQQSNLINLELSRTILNKFSSLQGSGAASELQYLDQKNKVHQAEADLRKSRLDRARQKVILQQEIQQISGDLSQLYGRLTESRVNSKYQYVRSPVDGIVFDLKPKGIGFVAQTSETVMKIVPLTALQANVQITSSDIGFVRVGRTVEISIDSFPASDFGVLQGTLTSIGSDALPPDQLNQSYRFPAKIRLKTQKLELKNGQLLPLQVGMSLTANIKLRKVSYLQLLLGGFQDKAKSLQAI